jgi:tetratricopeptide (TPR) repeat protein
MKQTLWSSQDLIRICTPGMEVPRLAVSSTAEEWEKSGNVGLGEQDVLALKPCWRLGRTLFRSKRYLQAMHCFDRAGLRRETAVAQAYLHREHARNLSGGTKQLDIERARAFIVAADAFSHCADEAITEKKAYYRAAGECYAQASQHKSAGKAFLEAAEYTLSARQYRKVNWLPANFLDGNTDGIEGILLRRGGRGRADLRSRSPIRGHSARRRQDLLYHLWCSRVSDG